MALKLNHFKKITFSAPGKVHLLGEHAVVYGKPALLATVDLRATVSISATTSLANTSDLTIRFSKVIDPIIKKHLRIKTIPPYQPTISSQLPLGAGLGSSAAISASYIASLLTFLKFKWDLNLINDLTLSAEKIFHGNPSGADNSIVIFGGLVWFRRETENLKFIHKLPFSIPTKLSKNFLLINTGTPEESTKTMVNMVSRLYQKNPRVMEKFLEKQEQLTREFLEVLREKNEKMLKNCIKMGEKNLESIGVVSKQVVSIIRKVEAIGGAAKICGGGGKTGATGILLCYHPNPSKLLQIAKQYNLEYFKTALGIEGLRNE